VDAGQWLAEAKADEGIPRGGWERWVEQEAAVPQSTAQRYIQIYNAVAEGRLSIGDVAESGQIGALKEVARRTTQAHNEALKQQNPTPVVEGKYGCIVIDPPEYRDDLLAEASRKKQSKREVREAVKRLRVGSAHAWTDDELARKAEAEDAEAFIWGANVKRRQMNKGQIAMIGAMGFIANTSDKLSERTGRGRPSVGKHNTAKVLGIAPDTLRKAFVIKDHAPDLVPRIIAGELFLDPAYVTAQARKKEADWQDDGLRLLRKQDPDLARRVMDGELTLDAARKLATENATQRGSTAAAALDAVAAISRVLAYNLLRWDEATFCEISQKVRVDYASCRGRLEAGAGIGRDCVQSFAPKDAFTITQIEIALGSLKDSGRMARIIADASARAEAELRIEQEAAERYSGFDWVFGPELAKAFAWISELHERFNDEQPERRRA
jgi:hypothetical protein